LNEDALAYLTEMNEDILSDLIAKYGQEVWNYAYFVTKNRSMADDITQDVFIQAYRHIASFRKESSVKTWLLKITRNISYNYRSSAFIRKVLLVDIIAPGGTSRSAEQAYLEQEATNDVWKHVMSLPTKHREVLVLHAKYQLTLKEIADVLQISEGTVKSRLHHARKRMIELMKEEYVYGTV